MENMSRIAAAHAYSSPCEVTLCYFPGVMIMLMFNIQILTLWSCGTLLLVIIHCLPLCY